MPVVLRLRVPAPLRAELSSWREGLFIGLLIPGVLRGWNADECGHLIALVLVLVNS